MESKRSHRFTDKIIKVINISIQLKEKKKKDEVAKAMIGTGGIRQQRKSAMQLTAAEMAERQTTGKYVKAKYLVEWWRNH